MFLLTKNYVVLKENMKHFLTSWTIPTSTHTSHARITHFGAETVKTLFDTYTLVMKNKNISLSRLRLTFDLHFRVA